MEMPHRVAIALGSNLGDSRQILSDALTTLDNLDDLRLIARSHFYQTIPVGPPQPDFINACAVFATCLDPFTFLDILLKTELQFGRERHERWGPRLLDLDLLLYDDLTLDQPRLHLPHPRMGDRAFVLIPLAEIAPDWLHPLFGDSIATLVQKIDRSGVHPLKT